MDFEVFLTDFRRRENFKEFGGIPKDFRMVFKDISGIFKDLRSTRIPANVFEIYRDLILYSFSKNFLLPSFLNTLLIPFCFLLQQKIHVNLTMVAVAIFAYYHQDISTHVDVQPMSICYMMDKHAILQVRALFLRNLCPTSAQPPFRPTSF